jgi:hypothetical protein
MRLPYSQSELPMTSLFNWRFTKAGRACWIVSCLCCSLFTPFLAKKALSQEISIAVRGELQKELSVLLADLKGDAVIFSSGMSL